MCVFLTGVYRVLDMFSCAYYAGQAQFLCFMYGISAGIVLYVSYVDMRLSTITYFSHYFSISCSYFYFQFLLSILFYSILYCLSARTCNLGSRDYVNDRIALIIYRYVFIYSNHSTHPRTGTIITSSLIVRFILEIVDLWLHSFLSAYVFLFLVSFNVFFLLRLLYPHVIQKSN